MIKDSVIFQVVDESSEGQRIDNFLIKLLKGVPKSHIYRIVRSGEVRVNSRRIDVVYRLMPGDRVRIPPVRMGQPPAVPKKSSVVQVRVVFEDDALLVVDKPSGLAVHGGSGVSFGLIEQIRSSRPHAKCLELVHRLDRETSGLIMIAKKRRALVLLHEMIRKGQVHKFYWALVKGSVQETHFEINVPLKKYALASGERRVQVEAGGQESRTVFTCKAVCDEFTLLEAELKTGRTHQIRVHLAHKGHPIAGDDKYGDYSYNAGLAKQGLKRMFLHARTLRFGHPLTGEPLALEAPLPVDLEIFYKSIPWQGL
ncbi:MAG: RluA family pseudouridine synthase [Proteobacteria bacterium]|nr:RluA family pseudouridine synthase [Pseudomonadota bacterium]MDE3208153.1 RluA family pseudouridine synthase [Pseudomonadota bacterium]